MDLALVGEAPGPEEDQRGEYFVGRAGKLLDEILDDTPWAGANVGYFNAVQCFPGYAADGFAKPTMEQVRACRPLLLENLALAHPGVIVALGQWGARALSNVGTMTIGGKRPSRMRRQRSDAGEFLVSYHPAAVFRSQPQLRHLIRDDLAQAHDLANAPLQEAIPLVGELTPEGLVTRAKKPTAIDFEYGPGGAIYSMATYDGESLRAGLIDRMEAEYSRGQWQEAITRFLVSCPMVVGHNIPADLLAAARFGCQLPARMYLWDTLVGARMAWENDPDRSLETLAVTKLGLPNYAEEIGPWKKSNPADFGAVAPPSILKSYNAGDAYASWRLRHKIPKPPPTLFYTLMEGESNLTLTTQAGAKVGGTALTAVTKKYVAQAAGALRKLRRLTGLSGYNPRDDAGKAYPWKVLKWKPLRQGKTGPSLDEDVLKHYAASGTPISRTYATALLAYRAACNRSERLAKDFTESRDAKGFIHPSFNTVGAARTCRDSSNGPNFQNLAPELRQIIVTRWPAGWITQGDLKGLEPRYMADRTGCQLLLDIFNDPKRAGQVYEIIGGMVLRRKVAKLDASGAKSKDYAVAKEIVLATNYNAMRWTLQARIFGAIGLQLTEEECQDFIDRYFKLVPEVKAYIWDMRRLLVRDQKIECSTGWVRHLENTGPGDYRGTLAEKGQAKDFKHAWNQAVNVDIQHSASMIAKLWSNFIQRALREEGLTRECPYLGPVHDSVNHDAQTKNLAKLLTREVYPEALATIQGRPMEALIGRRLRCPLDLETVMGKTWGEE